MKLVQSYGKELRFQRKRLRAICSQINFLPLRSMRRHLIVDRLTKLLVRIRTSSDKRLKNPLFAMAQAVSQINTK
jgi:hypothetical protein